MGCVMRFLCVIFIVFVIIRLEGTAHAKALKTMVDIYIHEFLSNEYRRSFVEMHYKFCDFILKDTIFRPFIAGSLPKTCPLPVVDIYIHEFLSNEYRRSFVEMHYKFCDFILKDTIFRPFIAGSLPKTCPLPVGSYHFENLSFPNLPILRSFPFRKGRVFLESRTRNERTIEGYLDMEIKQRWR